MQDSNDIEPMILGVCATNPLSTRETMILSARFLDPISDRSFLRTILSDLQVRRTLGRRNLRLRAPQGVALGLGRERLLATVDEPTDEESDSPSHVQIQNLGELSTRQATSLLEGEYSGSELILPLEPAELRQVLVRVTPCGAHDALYVVQLDQKLSTGELINTCTLFFATPQDFFAETTGA